MLCLCIWLTGLIWFIGQIPTQPSTDKTQTDAIVVLTGGSNRLEYGLKMLSDGLGQKLFISGVHENITLEQLITRNSTPEIREKLLPIAHESIILGHEAENTIGNAEETLHWIKSEQCKSIYLVTSNYHMPRSLKEFHKVIKGVNIIPAPVLPDDFSMNNWWSTTENRMLMLSEYHKFLASIVRHYIVSQLRHSES